MQKQQRAVETAESKEMQAGQNCRLLVSTLNMGVKMLHVKIKIGWQ